MIKALQLIQPTGTLAVDESPRPSKTKHISIYELLTVMTVMAYANDYNKLEFIFNVFDHGSNEALDLEEIALMTTSFLTGWGKLTNQEMPEYNDQRRYAEVIYSSAEYSLDGRITLKGFKDWVEQNENLRTTLMNYEPPMDVEEGNLTIKRHQR